ncbi:MAG: 7-cyano-7-deazaguanine synthase QueC [Candidatus Omnitrophica bacterium]|nr:7-cyano-7-deazaguanine synthase QueC [Candidatus Omnitrophota bacterium]
MRDLSRVKKDRPGGIVLLSGGIDSAVTLYLAKKYGYHLTALIFDYHQRHYREIESAKRIARLNKIPYEVVKVTLEWAPSSLTRKDKKVPFDRNLRDKKVPSTYVPGRNIIFLSYAVSFAESIGADAIFIGAHVHDYSDYPDCRGEFLNSFEFAVNKGIQKKGLRIIAPLLDKGKKDIIKLGLSLGVPFEETWSCYLGGKEPCLRCDSCRFRLEAFRRLNMTDPLLRGKGRGGDQSRSKMKDEKRNIKNTPRQS